MGRSRLITLVLTTIHLPTILGITTSVERSAHKNFRRHIGPPAPPTDWENGLREALYQMLTRERHSHPNLREYLSIAPILGQRNAATPFGDVAVLARGQLYLTNAGFTLIQDPNNYDCDECDEREMCGATSCQWSKPQNYGTLLALWTARRIRHRDRYYGHRYEVQYTISPVYSTSRAFVSKNGIFNYNIGGHVFATKDATVSQRQTLTERDCKRCDHRENYVAARSYVPATQNHENDRQYLPPHTTVMEIKPARFEGGFLLGLNPNGGDYVLQSLPERGETHEDAPAKKNLQKEIELYTRLLQSLARQRPHTEPTEYITNPSTTVTKFAPSTMPAFVSNTGAFPTTPEQKVTIPHQTTRFTELTEKTQTATTPSTQPYSKTTTAIRFPTQRIEMAMTRSTTSFRPSPNYVRYSEPDPLYHPVTMHTTTSRKFSGVPQKTTSSGDRVHVTKLTAAVTKPSVTTASRFSAMKYFTRPTVSSEANRNRSGSFFEMKRPQASGRQLLPPEATTIPNDRTGITSTSNENNKIPINKTLRDYEVTEASKREPETTTESTVIRNETEMNTAFIEETTTVIPTAGRALITQQNLSVPNIDETKREMTTVVSTGGEIIQTQETQETASIPHTTMNVVTTLNYEKNSNTLTTITFFDAEAADDDSGKELSTPQDPTVQEESEKHTTSLPSTVESTTKLFTTLEATDQPHETTENFITETPTVIYTEIPSSAEITTDMAIARTEKEVDLLDEIFGTVVTERTMKPTTMKSATKLKNTKEIDELFNDDVPLIDSETTTKEDVRIIFSNFYLASSAEPTTEAAVPTNTQEPEQEYTSETSGENEATTFTDEITTQSVPIPTSQSYSTSISFEVNKRNKTSDVNPELNENVKARLTEIKLNNTEFMIYKAELPDKKNELPNDKEMSASNTFDAIALTLVNHARSIDHVDERRNETKPRRKYRKSKHRRQKKITAIHI